MLTDEQRSRYEVDGCLLVSGLIPPETVQAAARAMWRVIGADPEDVETWSRIRTGHGSFDDPAIVAVYTPQFLTAAAELAGGDPASFAPPRRGYAINVFPQEGPWTWPGPHIDHAIKEQGHRTFPYAFRIAAMTFLNDVAVHGGGTVVWPQSHRRLEELARSDPARYEFMWALNQELRQANLGPPLELTPHRGDVLFYHALCAHAGSRNTSTRPRLALNMKW